MRSINSNQIANSDEFAAQLADAAYQAALQHGFRGSFLDLELAIWTAVRSVVRSDEFPRTSRSNGSSANKLLAATVKRPHASRLCLAGT